MFTWIVHRFKIKKTIFFIFFSCLLSVSWYLDKNFNHQGEWHSIGVSDLGMSGGVPLDRLDAASLTGDNKPIVDETRSYISGSPEINVRIPEEIDFMWRVAGEKNSHTKKIALRSTIPPSVLRTLRQRTPVHILSIEFFVKNRQPQFRWTLDQLDTRQADGSYTGGKTIAQSPP